MAAEHTRCCFSPQEVCTGDLLKDKSKLLDRLATHLGSREPCGWSKHEGAKYAVQLRNWYGSLQQAMHVGNLGPEGHVSRFGKPMQQLQEHREFFDRLGKQLGLNELDNWYSVTVQDIEKQGGRTLLQKYN